MADRSPSWADLARACAGRAHALRGECVRGVLPAAGRLAFFDILQPGRSPAVRDRAAALFARRLAARGVAVLAAATHPQSGPDDGLTLAVVLDAAPGREREVNELWRRAAREAGEATP